MTRLLALAVLLSAARADAQTAIVGDAWIVGQVIVGTTTPASSRFNVAAASATETPFQVSGVDLTPFLRVGKDGKVGLSTTSAAQMDVNGSGDTGDIAMMLHSGNLSGGGTSRVQIAFGQNGTTDRRHHIDSVHADSTTGNSVDFYIWTPAAGSAGTLATMEVASLVSISSASGASVHVMAVGVSTCEFTVSNGSSLGGGTIHVASQVSPSSREWKKDISYLTPAEEAEAYEKERALKHVSFRYAKLKKGRYVRDSRAAVRRGLIFEEAPAELRGPGESLSLDQRLLESELAFKEITRRLESLEQEAGR